jgi:hypothetical protein
MALQEQRTALQEQGTALQEQGTALQEQGTALQEQRTALQEQGTALQEQGTALQETRAGDGCRKMWAGCAWAAAMRLGWAIAIRLLLPTRLRSHCGPTCRSRPDTAEAASAGSGSSSARAWVRQ